MSEPRYVATFDSEHPEIGVVMDAAHQRYCTFPSVRRAEIAADRWNQAPLWDFEPPMVWRSTITGEIIAAEPTGEEKP